MTLESLAAKWDEPDYSPKDDRAVGEYNARRQCAAELRAELARDGWQPYVPGETVVEFGALYAIVNRRGIVVAAPGGLWTDPPRMLLRVPEPPR